jgi:integrase
MVMKQRFRLFQRGTVFYGEDTETGKQFTLNTRDRKEALRILEIKRHSVVNPGFAHALLKTCVASLDPQLLDRTWQTVIDQMVAQATPPTRVRLMRAFKNSSFDRLRTKRLIETTSTDFLSVLNNATVSTNHFLRRLHNLALGLGWIPLPILPPRIWPKVKAKEKRAITLGEHQKVLAAEHNAERKLFYTLLWEIGAAQTDAASLTAERIDWKNHTLSFQRMKTGTWSHIAIGSTLELILKQLPGKGALFPTISRTNANDRAAEFYRRCKLLKLKGISLHSYRYAWAERAKQLGYPERFAQQALGHNSVAVHRAYARNAFVKTPSLDGYGKRAEEISVPTEPHHFQS